MRDELQETSVLLEEFFPIRAEAVIVALRNNNSEKRSVEEWHQQLFENFVELLTVYASDLKTHIKKSAFPL
jgi:hypothetical protein